MMPQNNEDYKRLITEMIKKQILILGTEITFSKVKNVLGLEVSESGEVTSIEGDPQLVLQQVINQFVELSGLIVKKTMESILVTYPGMIGIAAQGAFGAPVSVSSNTSHEESDKASSSHETTSPIESSKSPEVEQPAHESVTPPTYAATKMSDLDQALDALSTSPMGVSQNHFPQTPSTA